MQPTMRPVSSKMTFFYKRVFPVTWVGFLLLLFAFGLLSASRDILFLIVVLLMAVFGYWFMKKVIFNLADAVLDAGDALVVRSGGGRTHRAVRHQERQLFALHVPASGHPVGAAAYRVR